MNFINYINGKDGSLIEIKNCCFKSISNKKYDFIDGMEMTSNKPKLHIVECNFEYEIKANVLMSIWNLKFAILVRVFAVVFTIVVWYQLLTHHEEKTEDIL